MTYSALGPRPLRMVGFAQAAAQGRAWRLGVCAALCASALSCGGGGGGLATGTSTGTSGGSTPTSSNVIGVVVDAGPNGTSANTLFTTVTICAPGSTTNCQTIDHIQVDTMSYGLRILAPVLTISLPVQPATSGTSLVECTAFADGYSWGPVALADVQVSGESASSVPVQVIGDSNFTNIPADCSGMGAQEEDTVATFGANGILGVGVFAEDCGLGCTTNVDNQIYYACTPTTACQPTTVASLTSEVTNPVTLFATDNNGVIIQLPSVAASGAATVTGSMIFGIDTQSNNKSGSQTILTVDPSYGDFTTVFNGQTLSQSFLDTGSNGIYFNDTDIAPCTANGLTDFYCPASTQSFTATLQGLNAVSVSETFSIGDAQTFSGDDVALPLLAGPFPSSTETFDWGLPFYYGRTVYTAIENDSTAVGTGPYVAF